LTPSPSEHSIRSIPRKTISGKGLPSALSDVAREAGVSLSTASRALDPQAGHPVRQETRRRVVEAASRLDYRPNPMAQALRDRRLNTIAVIVHELLDPYFAEIVRGAAAEAAGHGYLTFLCSSQRDPAAESRYVGMLRRSRVAVVLFAAGELDDRQARAEIAEHVAAIRRYGGAVVALAPRVEKWATEVTDNVGGSRLATEHLIALGHRRIAFIAGPERVRTSREREKGYLQAMEQARLDPVIERGDFTMGSGATATSQVLTHGRVTAIAVASDTMAVSVLAELARRGLRVPDDMSVVGFGDMPGWEFAHPALTTVRVNLAEIGAAGVRRALAQIDGTDRSPRVHVHPVSLVRRDSTQELDPSASARAGLRSRARRPAATR
jgi:LacI family transcriptional regulator